MKCCATFLSLLLLATLPITSEESGTKQPSYQIIENKALLPILNPALEGRRVEKLLLDNGMQVYLISDPGADQSAAGVAVEAGSWEDPVEYPGMAHFLEHMLFMGTEAYPNEFETTQFITDHGGRYNAFTASDRTVYMFSVNNDALEESLDRFSHFFIDPLLSPNCINRELHAVDQEHAKNIEHDGWRQYMILKESGNPNHPNSAFSTGNAQTLGGIPQSALRSWYQTHYSADQMHLVILSPLPLEEMRALAVADFSKVPRFKVSSKQLPLEITAPKQRGAMTFIKPVRDVKQLSLNWEVPALFATDATYKAPFLVAMALGQEGEGSLTQVLKKEKIAEGVRVSCDRMSKQSLFFSVDIQLTDFGLTQIDTAVLRVYQAIALLKKEGFPSYLFDEIQTMAQLNYQFQSRDDAFDTIMHIASELPYEELASFPEKLQIPTEYNPAFIQSFIETLKADKCLYSVSADPAKTGVAMQMKEKWMQAEYTIKPLSQAALKAYSQAAPIAALYLPPQNPYLPSDLTLAPSEQQKEEAPLLLASDAASSIYYAQDSRYQVPEIAFQFSFRSPLIESTARAQALSDLYIRALSEKLSTDLSLAANAGLSARFHADDFDLQLSVCGYHDKAPLLLKQIFAALKAVAPTREEFEIYRTSLASDYDNASKELPVRQAMQQLDAILFNKPTELEKLSAIKRLTFEEFSQFAKNLFQTTYTEGMLYGNISAQKALTLWGQLRTLLSSQPFTLSEHTTRPVLVLSEKYGPYKIVQPTDRQGNGVLLLLQEGPFSFESKAIQQVLGYALSDAFFDTLRTKQQTAYIAKAWNTEEERQLMQFFAVQSSTHTPTDLLARFELFLESFDKNLLTQISEERFESIQTTLITLLQMPPENMPGMMALLNELAFEYHDFQWVQKRIESIKSLKYERFCEMAHQLLSRSNPRRLAVLMEGRITPENDFHYELITKEEVGAIGSFTQIR